MTDILIIEDNAELGGLLRDFLEAAGHSVHLSQTGEEGVAFFLAEGAKLVLLDIMLPGIDGFAVCRKIRETCNAPIIIVSARIDKEDKLNGLVLGADDYVEKPYDVDILLAKISGIFKRRYDSDVLTCADLRLDKMGRTAYKNDVQLQMTVKEFDLLLFLAEHAGKALSKDALFNKIWGFDSFSEPQTLTVHIKRLREKIEDNPKEPRHIVTVWGVGYRFEE